MTFLPIVERELRTAARLTSTYRNRAIVAAVVTGVAMVMFMFGAVSTSPSQVGRAMFWTLNYMALAFCLFEGVRKTADCLSEEKREGTLGLLFLTDLRGYDIILGKLTAKSLNSVYGLFSVLPILALPLLLGGTTPGEYWRVVFALANLLFFSLCAGIWVSCWCNDERQAMTSTFLFVIAWIIGPILVHAKPFSPYYAILVSDDRSYRTDESAYWASLGISQALSWTLLLWASLVVPNCWRGEKIQAKDWFWLRPWRRTFPENNIQRANRARILERNPAYWLAGRDTGQFEPMSAFICAAVILCVCMIFFLGHHFWLLLGLCWTLNFAIKLRVAAQSCHCLAEARRNNALEMLLVTPLTVQQIIHGQILALRRAFMTPILIIFLLEWVGLGIGYFNALINNSSGNDNGFAIVGIGGTLIVYFGFFALDMVALAWTGMAFGLSSKKESHAIAKTILIVLVLPLLCMILACYGVPFLIGIPLVCIFNNRVKLQNEFRKLAGQPYAAPTDPGWLPSTNLNPSLSQQP